jgi:outer membrane lipoprotein SlyB
MKKVVSIVCFVMSISLVACKKDKSPQVLEVNSAKSSGIQMGEPVLFSFSTNGSAPTADWTVSPNNNVFVSANGSQASIVFGNSGNYVVTCVVNGVTAHTNVSVTNLIYNQSDTSAHSNILPFYPWDVINIKAIKVDTTIDAGLIFSAETGHIYACTGNSLATIAGSVMGGISLQYPGVITPLGCTVGSTAARGVNKISVIADGVSTLTIVVNGKFYSGTIEKTGNNYFIHWPENTPVIISPLVF